MSFEDQVGFLRSKGEPFAIATIVRTVAATSAKPGAKALVAQDGTIIEGWVGGGCARGAVARAARDAIRAAAPQFLSLLPEELLDEEGVAPGDERDGVRFARNGCPSKGSMDIFVEPVLPEPELIICGQGPVALALADLASRFELRRVMHAPGLERSAAPQVEHLTDDLNLAPNAPYPRYVVIATQGGGDLAALRAVLETDAVYIAFVGSRKKFASLRAKLEEGGMGADRLDRVTSPAGLDINAVTPDEIALSILAQVTQVRRESARGPKT